MVLERNATGRSVRWTVDDSFSVEYAASSVVGAVHADSGDDNQDRFGVVCVEQTGAFLLGVFDGHGGKGGVLAELARDHVLERCVNRLSAGAVPREALHDVSGEVAELVAAQQGADESGSTATVVVATRDALTVAYVGDSGAVLCPVDDGQEATNGKYLFELHRPSCLREQERVLAAGGLIEAEYVTDPTDTSNVISLTRAFGDTNMRGFGVTDDVELLERRTSDQARDAVLVVASDGLWDSDKASPAVVAGIVSRVVSRGGSMADCCFELSKFSGHEPLDDCTIIAARLRHLNSSNTSDVATPAE